MPNWCNNGIMIIGPADQIRALWDQIQVVENPGAENERGGLLQTLCPEPDYSAITVDPAHPEVGGTMPDWWNWRVAHWGTKWEVETNDLRFEDLAAGNAQIVGGFESAWSPPLEAFAAYSEANPDIEMELKYFEPGMGFVGVWDSFGGDAYWDQIGTLLDTTEEEDAVLFELLEYFDVASWYDSDEEETEEVEEGE